MSRHRRVALAVVLGLAAVTVLAGCGDDSTDAGPSSTTTTSASTTTASSSTTTTSSSTTTTSAGAVPGRVTVISAGPGGGSGEVTLRWDAVADATGYRVLRSDADGAPFAVVADLDVTSGQATAADEVVNIFSAAHSYVPPTGALGAPDPSPSFEYVEVDGAGRRCFRVVAYNAAGDAPASPNACGSPP